MRRQFESAGRGAGFSGELTAGLGPGINFGNALEAPREGDWGMRIEERFFDLSRAAGFSTIRLPVRWSSHAELDAPFKIDSAFFARVDWVVRCAGESDFRIVLDLHHYEEMMKDPIGHRPRFLALWEQIARRYENQPESVLFELCNEPVSIPPQEWNTSVQEALKIVRRTNPDRKVIVGGVDSSSISGMLALELPADDPALVATFHYYEPFSFTHQDAEWIKGSEAWHGTEWKGTSTERARVMADFDRAAAWGAEHDLPLWLGEFGAYSRAGMESRVRWTECVAREADKRSIDWAYWELGAGFGIYDREAGQWRVPLLRALLPETPILTTTYQISDNILVLYKGSLVESGDAETVIKKPEHPYTQLLISSIPDPDPEKKWLKEEYIAVDQSSNVEMNGKNACKFVDRCPHAMTICRQKIPPLYRTGPSHTTRCFLYRGAEE
jgi:endoglucanase